MRKLFLILMTLIACTWSLQAQTRTYHGTVLDAANNEPLIGATIMPIGGGQGSAADLDGKFTITVPNNVKQAKVSYVGYKDKTVTLSNNMTVYLESTSENLQDLVVIAYGTGTKESLTGSVAVVGAKEIEDRPVTSVTSALEGNAPGVQVNSSTGTPGSSPAIRIRGFNSFTSGAQSPLYVVDGVVYDGSIADLNPADIESMSVLKDAASCALYGNRGANGVILINTKRAKGQGNIDVTLQVRQGMYNRGLPEYDRLGADDWMETVLMSWARGRVSSGGMSDIQKSIAASAPSFISTIALGTNIYDKSPAELFDENGKLTASVLPGYNDLDWWKAISRSGYRQEYNVNAAGSTEKFDVFTSVGYLKENGYMLQTDFERFTGRIVANYQPVSFFKMGANIQGSWQKSQAGVADPEELNSTANPFLTQFYAPIQPYYKHDEKGAVIYDENGQPVWNTEGLNKGNNVAWNQRLDVNDWSTINVNGMLYGTVIIPYGFELTVRGSMYRNKDNGTEYSNNIIGSQQGSGGLDLTSQTVFSHTFMQTLNWTHDYGMHHIDVMLDHENYQYGYDVTFLRKSGQMLPGNIGSSNFENMDYSSQSKAMLRTESYLGRARYNFEQKYFGELSLRRDGSSRFSKDHRWGTFWSAGASWILTKEKFMQNIDWLNYLKLRVAYGSVGNDAAASAYSYWSTFYLGSYDKIGTLVPSSIASSDLKWESTKTLDIALEGSLFNDRLNFSVGYFDKRNADLLYNVTLPSSDGQIGNSGVNSRIMRNIGTMVNRGWELQFGVDIIRNASFNWNFNIDASFVKNKIEKLPNGRDIPNQALFQGKSLYEQYVVEWAGVDRLTGNSLYYMNPDSPDLYSYDENGVYKYNKDQWNANVENAKASGHYFEDASGRPMTDRSQYAYRKCMGTSLPTVYGSFGTNFSWKGINLGLLFTYSLGGKSYNGNYQSLMSTSTNGLGALHKDILNSWTAAPAGSTPRQPEIIYNEKNEKTGEIYHVANGDIDPDGIPVADSFYSEYNNAESSRWLVSNNYLCLKNVNVSYDFPKKWVSAMMLKGLNLGFSVDNLFIITRQKGLNPQYSFSGGQGAYYVPSRVFSFQLTVKL